MFGASLQNKPAGGSIFGNTPSMNQQNGGLFGGLGSNTQQNQQQQNTGGLFSGFGQNTQQNQQQRGNLFGVQQQQQPLFSTNQNTQQQGLFGQSMAQPAQNNTPFGQGQAQQNQALGYGFSLNPQQQQNQGGGLSGILGNSQQQGQIGSTQPALPQLGQSAALWQPQGAQQEKSIKEQMATVLDKWDVGSPNCVFKHYFYNKVDDNMAMYYKCPPNENETAWEEALQKKPGPGYIPVLCTGFEQMGKRIELQQRNLANFNARLHEINTSLTQMMQHHETKTSIRAMDARRKHIVLKQRCLALATKVQVLRNRGYAMGGDEEDLRTKLMILEKNIHDPGLDARGEEIWARMLLVQERARMLKTEFERAGNDSTDVLDEATTNKAKKILEDYNTQLQHLRTEVDSISKDLIEWQRNQLPGAN